MDVGYVGAMWRPFPLCAVRSLLCVTLLVLLKLFSFFVSSEAMYWTKSLACVACLWPRLFATEYFEPQLNLLNVCSRGVCADEIKLSLAIRGGKMNDGKDGVGPNLHSTGTLGFFGLSR